MSKRGYLLAAVLATLALALAGCGSSASDGGAAGSGATQSVATPPTGPAKKATGPSAGSGSSAAANDTANADTSHPYGSCLAAAAQLPSEPQKAQGREACNKAYDGGKLAKPKLSKPANDATRTARKACRKQAKQITNLAARQVALNACEDIN